MIKISRYIILSGLLLAFTCATAQGFASFDSLSIPDGYKPEFRRQLNHDGIDDEQRTIMNADGREDNQFTPSDKDEVNQLLTRSLVRKTDWLQYRIETDSTLDHRLKVFYLSGLENLIKYFRQNWKQSGDRRVNPLNLSLVIDGYDGKGHRLNISFIPCLMTLAPTCSTPIYLIRMPVTSPPATGWC